MSAPRDPQLPRRSVPLSQALETSAPLAGLMARVHQSRLRLAAVQDLLPATLHGSVRAGPLDDSAWVLLVDNAAAAAKLRQLLPALVGRLAELGLQGPEPKVKVQAPVGR